MRLVENWHQAWRWFSVRLAVVGGAVQGAVLAFPEMKDWLPDWVVHTAGAVMFLGIVLVRIIPQDKAQ